MQRRIIVLALFLSAACSEPRPHQAATPAPPPATSTQPQPVPQPRNEVVALTQRCTNARHGFSVSYPSGWRTNDGSVLPACSVFDPAPFELPRESEIPFELAISISAQDVPFAPTVTSSQWERVLSSERLTVAGRDAVRAEVEATGEGLAERGMRSLRYVIYLGGGRTLVATTYASGETYGAEKGVLAQMVETLSIP